MMTISIVVFIVLMFLAMLAGWTFCSLFTVSGRSDLEARAALMRSFAIRAINELENHQLDWVRISLDKIKDAQ